MTIYLIRHGKTTGNLTGCYIGRTDEPLCAEGIAALRCGAVPRCDVLFCSPMRRCTETAGILFPGQVPVLCEELRECDFGTFEGKNYLMLSDDPYYQAWIDSGGNLPFPEGESPAAFRDRCVRGFRRCVSEVQDASTLAFVVHGGTIMSVLEALAVPHRTYYDWLTENGGGWRCTFDGHSLTQTEKL